MRENEQKEMPDAEALTAPALGVFYHWVTLKG